MATVNFVLLNLLFFFFFPLCSSLNNVLAAKVPRSPCSAWRTNVESNNMRSWKVVPSACVPYVAKYMKMGQYLLDSKLAIQQSLAYVQQIQLVGDGKDAWIFDTDDTTLSNLPYYQNHKYGGQAYNSTLFEEWVSEGKAPVLPFSLVLYNKLLAKGVKNFFLTGRDEELRQITVKNLVRAGYRRWTALIMRGESDQGTTAVAYKSSKRMELVKKGYRIWGNVGDQWSDLGGSYVGSRTFKLPNPLYYIS